MSHRRVVVTGMGLISPLGETVEVFWDRILASESGIRTASRFDCAGCDVRIGGECGEFDPHRYLDRREVKRLDRFAQFALAAAQEAVATSGIEFEKTAPTRTCVVLGSGIGGLYEIEEQHNRLRDRGPGKVSAFTIPRLMANAASANLSIRYGAQGTSVVVATACASATNAMGDALQLIRNDRADVVITGGSEAALTPLGLAAFAAMKALSTRNDDPQHACRPFDRERDGFVLGEGAGILIFEELQQARRRGATILAEVIGFGASSDAEHLTQPSETGVGAAQAMRSALSDARLEPQDIEYINAHGTGTPLGDAAETVAIREVFGRSAAKLAVSSTKSSIGHLLGASGGVELIATIMGLRHAVAPPTINLNNPDPQCDLDYVPNTPRDLQVRRAISNSFGFGGHNACLVVARYE